ncbi:hypothetical protein COV23_00630 [Candidatus Wolfebacteria bacterium CG10_big_fil_rev_8_21_14_0_10_31_9]|uniref:Phage holin family protein n=1 Tax=Candidatus Wolfebacteria bacterium CG10_big_fil_rev_8_21_14_0_10_31_9 TaxID=1975070 RepID=A0A2H0RCM1_9BACT|nr:MAG: hypothetical protein COV23_00630 [Candidatus Wolfebacteria bacterium CG10_big_fil_rev_8_21_14_0_10_31_9]
MTFISKIIFHFITNILALFVASYFVAGFYLNTAWENLIIVGLLFTLINTFIRPILKLILSPIIIITLGLGILIVNAITLYILDYLSQNIAISGLIPLIYATLIISAVNLIVHFTTKIK